MKALVLKSLLLLSLLNMAGQGDFSARAHSHRRADHSITTNECLEQFCPGNEQNDLTFGGRSAHSERHFGKFHVAEIEEEHTKYQIIVSKKPTDSLGPCVPFVYQVPPDHFTNSDDVESITDCRTSPSERHVLFQVFRI